MSLRISTTETAEGLQIENYKLTAILERYTIALREYQTKYGNELFEQIEKEQKEELDAESIRIKYDLINSIPLIKEYEANQKKYEQEIEILKEELANKERVNEKAINSYEDMKNKYDKLQEEKNYLNHQLLMLNTDEPMDSIKAKTFDNFNIKEENIELTNKFNSEIEKANIKVEEYKTTNLEIKKQNEAYIEENKKLKDEYDRVLDENYKLNELSEKYKGQLEEQNNYIIYLEKSSQKDKKDVEKMEMENNSYKKQNKNLKEMFEESIKRKDAEINSLSATQSELKNKLKDLKYQHNLTGDELSNLKFQIAQLKQENSSLIFDRDHLTKILEDSNNAVQSASEKEKHVDDITREYKRKNEELNLEIIKLNQKIKMQESQISKYSNECANKVKERGQNYENLFNTSKAKYEEIIRNKNEEISNLKAENLRNTIEKDKYANEYKILKNEYAKIHDNFNADNGNYIAKYEESQQKLNSAIKKYEEELTASKIKSDKLENENKMANDELRTLRENDKLQKSEIFNYMKNESKLNEDLVKAKEKISFFTKQNENLNNENNRLNGLYEAKIKNMNKEFDIKVITLENTIQYQKDKLALIEGKAFDMLKKQENLTEKFKKEYFKTIEYYENLIAQMNGNVINTGNAGLTLGNTCDVGVGVSGNYDNTPNNNNILEESKESDDHF